MGDEKQPITWDEALHALDVVDGHVHSFRPAYTANGLVLVGIDLPLATIERQAQRHGLEVSGEVAMSMHHGVGLVEPDGGQLFFATRKDWAPP